MRIVSELIGSEIYNHGWNGEQKKSDQQLLSEEELRNAIVIIFERLAGTDREKILSVPLPRLFFYSWLKAKGDVDLKKWMSEVSVTDTGFLNLMNKLKSWMSSDKIYHPLNRREVESFMDADAALDRIRSIAADTKSESDKDLAEELLAAVEIGDWRNADSNQEDT